MACLIINCHYLPPSPRERELEGDEGEEGGEGEREEAPREEVVRVARPLVTNWSDKALQFYL